MPTQPLLRNPRNLVAFGVALVFALYVCALSAQDVQEDSDGNKFMDGFEAQMGNFKSNRADKVYSLNVSQKDNSPNSFALLNAPTDAAIADFKQLGKDRGQTMVAIMNNLEESIKIGFNTATAGNWSKDSDGNYIWHLKVHSPGAHGQRVYFDHFICDPGVEVRVYNPYDPLAEAFGPFTNKGLGESETLLANLIISETVIVECFVPAKIAASNPNIELNLVGTAHYFESIIQKDIGPEPELRECLVDPTCFPDRRFLMNGVFQIDIPILNPSSPLCPLIGIGACSGNQLANVASRTFFLTAFHCYDGMSVPFDCRPVSALGSEFFPFWQSVACNIVPAEGSFPWKGRIHDQWCHPCGQSNCGWK